MTSYRLAVPHPWEKVTLDSSMPTRVKEIVDAALKRMPSSVSPDELAPHRHRLERELLDQLKAARDNGGLDYYLPTDLMHGQQLNANFVVSGVIPAGTIEPGLSTAVSAQLLAGPGTEPVGIDGHVWVRREQVSRSRPGALVEEPVGVRRVEYLCPLPDDERRWIMVTFTTVGDGDPDSEVTGLIVELFDAIMSTWRWVQDGAT